MKEKNCTHELVVFAHLTPVMNAAVSAHTAT